MIDKSFAIDNGVAVKSLNLQNNSITMVNGRELTYDCLLLATGMGVDYDYIPGLLEALKDSKTPVYAS